LEARKLECETVHGNRMRMKPLLLAAALSLVPLSAFARSRPRQPVRRAPTRKTPAHGNHVTLVECDRLIGDAARHIGRRQTREAVLGKGDGRLAHFLRQMTAAVDLLVDAQLGKRKPAEALKAAQALKRAAVEYDLAWPR
jgi:hypothetical protein